MRASTKQFLLSSGIFAVFFMATALVFRQVPSTEQFYAFGVCGVLFSFLTEAWARLPREDFQPLYGTGPIVCADRPHLFGRGTGYCLSPQPVALKPSSQSRKGLASRPSAAIHPGS